MPAPYQVTTAAANTALSYATGRHIEQLCDGSYLALIQTAATTLTPYQITSPSGTPTFTALTQTFVESGSTNTVGDLYILNNGTTTSDVWVVYGANASTAGIKVAHATYTASGSSWSWDNTGTAVQATSTFNVPTICWNGTSLIVLSRVGSYQIEVYYTLTKNGSAGWSAGAQLSSSSGVSHYFPTILHDATNSITVAVYCINGDKVVARVIADASTPSVASWSAETVLSTATNVGVGAANIAATLDAANSRCHVIYNDSTGSANPHYTNFTYTSTTISAGTPFSVSTATTTAAGVSIGLDGASPPNVWMAWGTAAVGSASDIKYVSLASTYASGNLGTVTDLTNATANDNTYPNLPRLSAMPGYAPLLYEHATGSFPVEYDNSITVSGGGSSIALSGTVPSGGALSASGLAITRPLGGTVGSGGAVSASPLAVTRPLGGTVGGGGGVSGTLSTTFTLAGTVPSGGGVSAAGLVITRPLSATMPSGAGVSGALTVQGPGTGIGDLTVTTKSQTWSGGPAGSPGTETDVTYKDASGSGWSVGLIPTYGGMPIAVWYEVDSNTVGSNQNALTTSTPDGAIHWLEQSSGAVFGGSEDKPFTLTELAPTGTVFRRYYQCTFGPDANGFNWAGYACIYPGDPGLIAYRFDCINPSGSAITLASSDSLEIALLGGLEQADSTWTYGNGGYGTLAGGNTTPWPTASAGGNPVSASPDYAYIVPASGSGVSVGRVTALAKQPSALSPAWSSVQLSALVNASRLKLKVFGTQTSFPASTTSTAYLLWAFRRNLVSTDAFAIAADYIHPGAPSVATGSYTSFSYDEAAYVFAAAGSGASNALTTTLDLSPAHVSVRYKPRFKVTGWTATAAPRVIWGGSLLTPGVDYRWYNDTTNGVLYLHLYADVVTSGAVGTQRNNAALALTPGAVALSGTVASGGGVSATGLAISRPLAASVASGGALSASGLAITRPLSGTLTTGQGVSASGLAVTRPLGGTVTSGGALPVATLAVTRPLAGTLASGAGVSAVGWVVMRPLAATIASGGGVSGTLTVGTVGVHLSATVPSGGALSTSGLAVSRPLGGTVATGQGVSGALAPTRTLSGAIPSGAGVPLPATLFIARALAATIPGAGSVSGSLFTLRPPTPAGLAVSLAGGPVGGGVTLSVAPSGLAVTEA